MQGVPLFTLIPWWCCALSVWSPVGSYLLAYLVTLQAHGNPLEAM